MKCGSLTETAFQPTALSDGTMLVSLSTNRKGARCGSNFLICSTSSIVWLSLIIFLLAAARSFRLDQPAQGMNFAQPFSYRFRRNPAIILAAGDFLARYHGGARRQPRARSDLGMVRDTDLAAQDREITDHRASPHAGLGNQY